MTLGAGHLIKRLGLLCFPLQSQDVVLRNHSRQKTVYFSSIIWPTENSKKDLFYVVWAIERCINCNVSVNVVFANPSSNTFVDFIKVDLHPKLLEKLKVFDFLLFQLIYNFAKV